MHNLLRCALLCATALFAVPALAAPPPGGLAPHKAIYVIKMTGKSSASQILNISGEMYFELKAGCDAWTTDHRFNLNYEYSDSQPMLITSDFTTYEPYSGRTLDFNSRRARNGEIFEELRGRADIEAGKPGAAIYNVPPDMRFNLPAGTLYPMGHTAQLLKEIESGRKFFSATVFDGSDDEGPAEISAFIGKPVDAMAALKPAPDIDTTLINTPAHNLRMAFFPLTQGEADAEYEMNAIFHNNGIISDMTVEYKEFTVHQSLKALQRLEPEGCKTGTTENEKAAAPPASPKNNGKDGKKPD